MKKKIILRCLFGAPAGLCISYLITIVISLIQGDGNYYPVVPELIDECGNEITAVLIQAVFSLLYGAAWAGGSVLWELESWSLLRMTVTHLIVCSVATFPIAYLMRWMPHNVIGILIYFGIFFGLYIVIWISQYHAVKNRIRQMNEKIWENNKNV